MAIGYRIADGYLYVTADTDSADRKLDNFFRHADGRLRDARGRFASEGNLAGLKYGEELTKGADKESERGFRGMFGRWGKRFSTMGAGLGRLFANKFVGLAAAGLGALPSAISAVSSALGAAINIAGAGAALAPAGIGALLLTIGSLKTAFSGLGAALKAGLAGDMAKFNQATKDMAPSMKAAALALAQLNPQLKALKKGVQENFWGRFVADIKPLAQTYLPMLGSTMATIGAGFGVAAHEVAGFLMQTSTADAFFNAFDSIGQAVRNVTSGLAPLVRLFATLFTVGASFLPGLTQNFAGIANSLANMAQSAAATGKLQAFIQAGLDKVKALGAALADIVGIFRSLGAAASGIAGGGLFGAIGQLLDMVNRFFQTLQGQQVLTNFFARLQAIGQLIIGLVGGALPGLLKFSDGLLTALQSLAPIAPVVGKAIGDALAALAPLLPVIGKVLGILLTLASGILSTIAAELGPMIALWGQLATGLADKLLPVIQQMITQGLPVAIQLGKNLADAFAPLVPIILDMASAFMDGLMQALPSLLDIGKQLLPVVSDLAKQMGGAMLDALRQLQPYIPDLVKAFVLLVKIFAVFMGQYLPNAIRLFTLLVEVSAAVFSGIMAVVHGVADLVGWFGSVGSAIGGFLSSAGSTLLGWVESIAGWFQALPGRIWNALVSLVTSIPNIFSNAINKAAFAVGYGIGTIIKTAMDLPGKIWQALSILGSTLVNLFTSAWASGKAVFVNNINTLIDFAKGFPGRVWGAIKSLGSIIASVAVSAWNAAKSAFSSGVNAVTSFASSLPGRIRSAVGSLGGLLYNAGRDVVRGIGNGISSMLGWVYGKAREIASNILAGAKKALGIGSPSKVMAREVGRWIPPGIQQGIESNMPRLQQHMADAMVTLAQQNRTPQISVNPAVDVGGTVVHVYVGDEEIAARVVTPKRVAKANVEGQRQRNFLNTGRLATV